MALRHCACQILCPALQQPFPPGYVFQSFDACVLTAPPWQAINASAEIIETKHASVDLHKVININAFSLDRVLEEEPDFLDVRLL
mgnify:CR=1 FL=1